MRLADEVRDQIEAFVEGELAPVELSGWLDSVADEVGATKDAPLQSLVGQTYTLLAERSYGDRTTADVRDELAVLMRGRTTHAATHDRHDEALIGSDAQAVTHDARFVEPSFSSTTHATAYA